MFSDLISKAEKHYASAKPFVLYRKPKAQTVKGIFQTNDVLHYVQDYTEKGFVFAPFNSEANIILLQVDETVEAVFEAMGYTDTGRSNENSLNDDHKEFHIKLIKKGIRAIEENEFKKVVLSRRLDIAFDTSVFALFINLLKRYSKAFCYLFYHPKVGLWLGATPELLLKTSNKQLKTMSLAGTQQYTGLENPVWGKKELEEQELVTAYIADALSLEVSKVEISETTSVRAGNLWHLRTSVSGHLKNNSVQSVVAALHPTPAVCGMPRAASKNFIARYENYDREYYTGFLGELNFKKVTYRDTNKRNKENQAYKTIKNTSSLYVNLRCMKIKNQTASIYIGGGITAASIPEKEWEETKAKSETMLQVFNNFS
ncbi:chorismate-binding protein [Cellulophaga sp. Hel_I_12]|uniref:chorismate-binding protein n=1 Tax=Cellulophaga sp. Hel_I_12 TaxID=1249972 RepID=UPI000645C725|nr:chorismate-binding protein [Cellulophaga sp. Hel_I_12]